MNIHPSNYPPIIKPRKFYEKAVWAVFVLMAGAASLATAGMMFWMLYLVEKL